MTLRSLELEQSPVNGTSERWNTYKNDVIQFMDTIIKRCLTYGKARDFNMLEPERNRLSFQPEAAMKYLISGLETR